MHRDTDPITEGVLPDRSLLMEGVRRGLGPAAATLVFGISYGVSAAQAGWGFTAPLVFSVLAFSGSAQVVLLTTLNAGVVSAIAAAVLVNVRYVVMSIAVNESLRGSRWRRVLHAQTLADASFAIAHRGEGRFDPGLLIGSCIPQWSAWVGGTLIGLLFAPGQEFIHTFGLDVAFPAFFVMLVIDEVRHSRRALGAAVIGAAVTGVALLGVSTGLALLLSLLGALLGLRPDPKAATP